MKFVKVTNQEEYDLVTQKMSAETGFEIVCSDYDARYSYISVDGENEIGGFSENYIEDYNVKTISATEYLNSHTLSNEAVTLKVKLRGNKVKINVKRLDIDKLQHIETPHFFIYKAKLFNRISECSLALYETGKVDYKFDNQSEAVQWIEKLVSCFETK